MVSLEQVQLLETRVSKAVDYVQKITAENAALTSEKMSLQKKLEANQKRIDELEVLIMRFKEDQGRIEDGIIAALDRLSQFEEAFENSLKEKATPKKPAAKVKEKEPQPESKEIFFEIQQAPESSSSSEEEKVDEEDEDTTPAGELDIF